MRTIHKYVLDASKWQQIGMPEGAVILTVREQRGDICMWAEVDTTKPFVPRAFEVFGTGHEMPVGMGIDRKYIGTAMLQNIGLVFHVYESF